MKNVIEVLAWVVAVTFGGLGSQVLLLAVSGLGPPVCFPVGFAGCGVGLGMMFLIRREKVRAAFALGGIAFLACLVALLRYGDQPFLGPPKAAGQQNDRGRR